MILFQVIAFYLVIFLIFYLNRDKVSREGIIFLLRSKLGIKLMDRLRNSVWTKIFAGVSIVAGFYLMAEALFYLLYGIYEKVATFTPLIPGTKIPGTEITIPFLEVVIAIFVVAAIHEFAHGVLIRRYGAKIKSTGLFLLGPFIGAFVEPDEEDIKRLSTTQQVAIFNAGSTSNLLSGILFLLIATYLITPVVNSTVNFDGVLILNVTKFSPAYNASLHPGELIMYINGTRVRDINDFFKVMEDFKPYEYINITTNESVYIFQLGEQNYTEVKFTIFPYPKTVQENVTKPYIGISFQNHFTIKNKPLYDFFSFLLRVFQWLFMISIGVGIANMLPALPFDGGRTILALLSRRLDEEKALRVMTTISAIIFLLIIINISLGYIH